MVPLRWMWRHVLVPAGTATKKGATWLGGVIKREVTRVVDASVKFVKLVAKAARDGAVWVHRRTVVPAARAVRATASFLYNGVLCPAGRGGRDYMLKPLGRGVERVVKGVVLLVKGVVRVFVVGGNFLYQSVLAPAGRAFRGVARAALRLVLFTGDVLYSRVLVPIAVAVKTSVLVGSHALYAYVLTPIGQAVAAVAGLARSLVADVIMPALRAVKNAVMDLLRAVGRVIHDLGAAVGGLLRMLGTAVGDVLRAIADLFRAIGKKLGG